MIFQIYIWVLSFISIFIASLWIIVNYVSKFFNNEEVKINKYPFITVAIPCYNEEKTIVSTLKVILNQNYFKNKIEIIIVDDLSKDKTVEVVTKFIKGLKRIKLIKHSKNLGKAGAMNTALKISKGDLFWVYDADSLADRNLLINMVKRFYEKDNKDVAAVVAITLINNEGKWIEKMQRLEYIMAAFSRKLLGSV